MLADRAPGTHPGERKYTLGPLPMNLTTRLTELRLDLEAADQGRLQLGLVVTVATLAVLASGWPPGHPVQRGLFFVLGALPALAIGTGLIVSGLIEAHSHRQGEREADDREVEVLRARIAAEARWTASDGRGATSAWEVEPENEEALARVGAGSVGSDAEPEPPVRTRMPRPLSARKRSIRLRSGHLGLR